MRVIVLLICLALQACGAPGILPKATSLTDDPSSVVVIGKIELVPPIDKKLEQKSYWDVADSRMLAAVYMATGPEFKPVNPLSNGRDFRETVEAHWGTPYMIKAPRQRTFLNGAMAFLDVKENDKLWFPGGYYFEVPKDAVAVYIGTLRYYRNDFNKITKVEVIDERRDIEAVLKSGESASKVRSSLLKKVPTK